MPRLPDLKLCLIAEQVRPEPNNKSTILGLYGVAPDVDIVLPELPNTVPLAALLICERSTLNQNPGVELEVRGPQKSVVPRMSFPHVAPPKTEDERLLMAINFPALRLTESGEHTLLLWSDGVFHSWSSFQVRVGASKA